MDKAYIVSQLKEMADRSKLDIREEMIATYLGIAPESLSRIRSAMREDQYE